MALEKFPDQSECPLCMEPLEMDDINFYPCTCGYQICRFCWHRIRTNENGLCPACRKQYPEDPAEYKPLTAEELQKIKSEKRQKDIQKKQKVSESRKLLSQVRVVQKNLVFIVGLTQKLADPEVLKKHEYFGRFGKIHKIVINTSTTYAGSGGPTASAYITYVKMEDALRAIHYITQHNIMDGRIIKSSLGTTKYCSHFLKGSSCPKTDCMYLHEMGEEGASFTKEEMQAGRHQEYEMRLLEQTLCLNPTPSSTNSTSSSTQQPVPSHPCTNNYIGHQSHHLEPGSCCDHHGGALDPQASPSSLVGDPLKLTFFAGPPPEEGGTGPFIENNNTRYYYTNNVDLLLDNVSPPSSSPPPPAGPAILNHHDDNHHPPTAKSPPTYEATGARSSALVDTDYELALPPASSQATQNGHLSDGNSNLSCSSKSRPKPGRGGGGIGKSEQSKPPVDDQDKSASQEALLKISQSLSLQMELIFKKKMAAAAAAAGQQASELADQETPRFRQNTYQHHQQPPPTFGAQDEPPYVPTARRLGHTRHLSGPEVREGASYDQHHAYGESQGSSHFLSHYLTQDCRNDAKVGSKEFSKESLTDTGNDDILDYINNITANLYPPDGGNNAYDPKNAAAAKEESSLRADSQSNVTPAYHQHHQQLGGTASEEGVITIPPPPQQQRYQILLRDGQRKVLSADPSSAAGELNVVDQEREPAEPTGGPELKPHSLRALSAEKLCSHLDQPSLRLYDQRLPSTTYHPQQRSTAPITEAGLEYDGNTTRDAAGSALVQPARAGEMNGDEGRSDGDTNLANATFPDWQEAFGFGPSQKHIEDDLGFDPYNESTKALAELIQQEQRPHHEPRHHHAHCNNNNNPALQQQQLPGPMQTPGGNAQRYQETTKSLYKAAHPDDAHPPLNPGDEANHNYTFAPSSPLKPAPPFLPHFDPSLSQYPLGAAPPTPLNAPCYEDGLGVGSSSQYDTGGCKNALFQQPGLNTNPYYQSQQHPALGLGNDTKRFATMPGGVTAPMLGPPAAAMMLNFLSSASSGLPPNSSSLSGAGPANRHLSHLNAASNFDSNGSNTNDYPINIMTPNNSLDEASSDKNGSPFFNSALLSNMIQQYMMTYGGNLPGCTINPSLPHAQNFIGGMATMSQSQILARLQQMMTFNPLTSHDQSSQPNNSGGAVTSFCNLVNALTLGINNGLPLQHMFNAAGYNSAASTSAAANTILTPNSTPCNLNAGGAPNLRTFADGQMGQQRGGSYTSSSCNRKPNQFGVTPSNQVGLTFGGGSTTAPSPFGVKDVADALKAISVCQAGSLNSVMSPPPTNNFIQSPSPFINFASMNAGTGAALNGFRIPSIPSFNAATFLNQQQQQAQHYPGEMGNSHVGNSQQQLYKKGGGAGQGFDKCSSTTPPAFMDSLVSAAPPSPHSLFLRSMLSPPFSQLLSAAAAGMSPLKLFQHPTHFPLSIASNHPYNYSQNNQSYGNEHGNHHHQQPSHYNGGPLNNSNGQHLENNHLTLDGYNGNKNMSLNTASYNNGPLMDQLHMHVSPVVMASQGNHNQNYSQHQQQPPPMPQMDMMTNFQAAHPPPVYLNATTTSPSSNCAPAASDANYHGRGEGPYNVPFQDPHPNASGPAGGYGNDLKGGASSYHHNHHPPHHHQHHHHPYMGDHLANNSNNNSHNVIMGAGGHGTNDSLGPVGGNTSSTYSSSSNPLDYGGPLANDFPPIPGGSAVLYPDPCSMWSSVNGLGRAASGSDCGNGGVLNSGHLASDNLEGN